MLDKAPLEKLANSLRLQASGRSCLSNDAENPPLVPELCTPQSSPVFFFGTSRKNFGS